MGVRGVKLGAPCPPPPLLPPPVTPPPAAPASPGGFSGRFSGRSAAGLKPTAVGWDRDAS